MLKVRLCLFIAHTMERNLLLAKKKNIEGLITANLLEIKFLETSKHDEADVLLDFCFWTRWSLVAEHKLVVKQLKDK